jgi:hypothetical protein
VLYAPTHTHTAALLTPAHRYKLKLLDSPACPLCPDTPKADLIHILYGCQHPEMVAKRQALTLAMLEILTTTPGTPSKPRREPYMESHSLTPHPATTIAAKLMYPLSPHLWNMPAPIRLFLYGLPEARLYTQTGHTVTVRLPSTTFATQTRLSRVHDTIFWRLIAQHPLTHKLIPLQRPEYDQRARDIHAQLLLSPYDTIALSEQGTSYRTHVHNGRRDTLQQRIIRRPP